MAKASSITPSIWETAVATYDAACKALEEAESGRVNAEHFRDAAEEALFAIPSPHLGAVAFKLGAMWSDNFAIMTDPTVDTQRTLIADIKRFAVVCE